MFCSNFFVWRFSREKRTAKSIKIFLLSGIYKGINDGSNNLLRKFIYGPGIDEPIMMIDVADGNSVYYYHFDGLGSVVAISDTDADIVERYSYNVFGEPNRVSDVNNPYLFTCRRHDNETAVDQSIDKLDDALNTLGIE